MNLLQINSTQSVVSFTSNMNAPELKLKCPRKVYTYAIEANQCCVFLYKLVVTNLFCALTLWCMECREINLKQFNIRLQHSKT